MGGKANLQGYRQIYLDMEIDLVANPLATSLNHVIYNIKKIVSYHDVVLQPLKVITVIANFTANNPSWYANAMWHAMATLTLESKTLNRNRKGL